MPSYTPNPDGSFTITRDDGTTMLSAIAPPGVELAQPPAQPEPPAPMNLPTEGDMMRDYAMNSPAPLTGTQPTDYARKLATPWMGPAKPPTNALTLPDQEITAGEVPPVGGGPQQPRGPLLPPGFGAPHLVRGGERKAGEVIGSTSYGPEGAQHQANLKRAQQNEYEGAESLRDANVKAAEGTAGVLAEVPGQLQQYRDQYAQNEENRQRKIAEDQGKYADLQAETRREINPNRIWADKSNMERGMASLAVGFGMLGAAMTGQKGGAIDIYRDAMDRDIDAQKTNLANAHHRFEEQRSVLADNMKVFGDQRQAEVATKAQYLEQAQAKVASMVANAQSDDAKAKGNILLAQLQKEAEKNDLEMAKVTHQVHTTVVPDRVVGGGAGTEDLNRSLVVQDLTGKKFLARDEKAAAEVRTKRSLTQSTVMAANKMAEIASKPGFDKLDPTEPLVQEFNMAREQFINGSNTFAG